MVLESKVIVLTPALYKSLVEALDTDDRETLLKTLQSLHPADVADFIERLAPQQRRRFFALTREILDAEVFAELHPDILESALCDLSTDDLIRAIKRLDSDDAVAVLDDMSHTQQHNVLQGMESPDRKKLLQSLTFAPHTAGRIMQSEIAVMPEFATVNDAFKYLRSSNNLPDTVFDIYLVTPGNYLKAALSISDLVTNKGIKGHTHLKDIAHPKLSIPVSMDQEEIAYLFKKYALVSAPVVNDSHQLLGMITVDDIIDVIDKEADEDFRYLGGVIEAPLEASALKTSYVRLRWLFVTFINTLIASSVLYQFQAVLEQYVALAILMPIVAAMGGNAGMQVVTVTVRAIATQQLQPYYEGFGMTFKRIALKEIRVGLLNGVFFALFLATIASIWFHNTRLGLVLAAAMIFNVVWAGFAGSFLPLAIYRLGFDPAIGSGPFLTTTTDVIGFTVFLGLAKVFLVA